MKRRQVTIKDIARELGISKSTVSRALKGAEDISSATRTRVMKKAREMDYHPNISALNLQKGRTQTIGVVIPAFTIPFYSRVISAMQNEAIKSGFNIVVCQSNEQQQQEVENIEILTRSGVDGIALSLARDVTSFDHIRKLKEKGFPVVLFNRVIPDLGFSTVTVDDFGGAKQLTEYLIGKGRKKIAFIGGPPGILLARERRRGFEAAMAGAGLLADEKMMASGDFTLEAGRELTLDLLAGGRKFDSLFCICDQVAYGAMEALKSKQIQIPGDVAVVGFTNESVSALTSPALTTMNQPMEEIGQKVARVLINHINHYTVHYDPVHVKFNADLIIRESA